MSTRSGALQHGGEQPFDVGAAGRFGGVEPAIPSGCGDFQKTRFGLVLIAADQHDFGACAGKSFGHGAAQFAGAADDDGNFASE